MQNSMLKQGKCQYKGPKDLRSNKTVLRHIRCVWDFSPSHVEQWQMFSDFSLFTKKKTKCFIRKVAYCSSCREQGRSIKGHNMPKIHSEDKQHSLHMHDHNCNSCDCKNCEILTEFVLMHVKGSRVKCQVTCPSSSNSFTWAEQRTIVTTS